MERSGDRSGMESSGDGSGMESSGGTDGQQIHGVEEEMPIPRQTFTPAKYVTGPFIPHRADIFKVFARL